MHCQEKLCTLMTDGWTDPVSKDKINNFNVSAGDEVFFLSSENSEAESNTGMFIAELVREVIKKQEAKKSFVIAVVADNSSM